jgi:hypothetical protein
MRTDILLGLLETHSVVIEDLRVADAASKNLLRQSLLHVLKKTVRCNSRD